MTAGITLSRAWRRAHPGMALLAAFLLAGCAGPMPTVFAGEAPARDAALPADFAPAADMGLSAARWQVVRRAVTVAGIAEREESGAQLFATLTERPAGIGVTGGGEAALAPAKTRRPFQSCKDRTVRLVLSLTDRRSGAVLRRGWAEESHCRGSADDALPRLAGHAAEMLVRPAPEGQRKYWRED